MAEIIPLERRAAVHAALAEPARLAVVDALALGDASTGELGAALDLPSNLLAHHLRVLEEAGVVQRARSEADRRRTYVRLVPRALEVLGPAVARPVLAARVVFVCTRNSARSQLAAALRRAISTARRHGLILGAQRTTSVRDVLRTGDLVVAVCDNAYEQLNRRPQLHWSVPDPVRPDTDDAFESAFAEIAARVDRLTPVIDTAVDPRPGTPVTQRRGRTS